MADQTPEVLAESEDGHNAARKYREFHERTQRFILDIPDDVPMPEYLQRKTLDQDGYGVTGS